MEPEDWFTETSKAGNFLWNILPAAGAEVDELLCGHLPHEARIAPWQLKNTELVDRTRCYLHQVQKASESVEWDNLRQLLVKASKFQACRQGWHRKCYEAHSEDKFPCYNMIKEDEDGFVDDPTGWKDLSVPEMVIITCLPFSVTYVSFGIYT